MTSRMSTCSRTIFDVFEFHLSFFSSLNSFLSTNVIHPFSAIKILRHKFNLKLIRCIYPFTHILMCAQTKNYKNVNEIYIHINIFNTKMAHESSHALATNQIHSKNSIKRGIWLSKDSMRTVPSLTSSFLGITNQFKGRSKNSIRAVKAEVRPEL